MPTLSKTELSEQISSIRKSTENFVESYKTRHNALYSLSSILPYNQERLRAANLIERISKSMLPNQPALSTYDDSYKGKAQYVRRQELSLSALKGVLIFTLLNIDQEDKVYKTTWTACVFKPTPLKDTALFSLSLEALGVPSLAAIPLEEIFDSLSGLSKYISIMGNNPQWDKTEIPSILLANIEKTRATLEAPTVEAVQVAL